MSNLSNYTGTNNISKYSTTYKKYYTRTSVHDEKVHGKNRPIIERSGNRCHRKDVMDRIFKIAISMPGWPNTHKKSKLSYSVKI